MALIDRDKIPFTRMGIDFKSFTNNFVVASFNSSTAHYLSFSVYTKFHKETTVVVTLQ